MKLSEIIEEMIDINIDQAIEKHVDSGLHGESGVFCGHDPRPERLAELAVFIDRFEGGEIL